MPEDRINGLAERIMRHRRLPLLLAAALAVPAATALAGCGQAGTTSTTTVAPTTTISTLPVYHRRQIAFYRGVSEPRPESWQGMVNDKQELLGDGINAVAIDPPVLIAQRGGLLPREILTGEAANVPNITRQLHAAGLAVFLDPSTKSPGLSPSFEATAPILSELNDDAVKWADTAEKEQAELFAPLDDYNLVLGTAGANNWSKQVLPLIRQKYHGPLVAKVVPDLSGQPPAPGVPHDFEALDFHGYDYLMLDIYPCGAKFDQKAFSAYVEDVLDRAAAVARRDGLKGVMIGDFGAWRHDVTGLVRQGPLLSEQEQASMAAAFLMQVIPRTQGVFYHGWTLPGRGAKGHQVEGVLKKYFTQALGETAPAATGQGKPNGSTP